MHTMPGINTHAYASEGTLLFPGATLDHVTTLISKRAVSESM